MAAPRVQLLFFAGCPHVAAARAQLERALAQAGLAPTWEELDVTAPDAPAHLRAYGSPTVLVDGVDVSGVGPGDAATCRLYSGSEVPGAPPLASLMRALHAGAR